MPGLLRLAFCSGLTAGLLIFGGAAAAELLEVDLRAAGDGLVTRDTRTGLDWLDLTETVGLSFGEVSEGARGWIEDDPFNWARWRYANEGEMCGLMESFAIAGSPCPENGFGWSGSDPSTAYFGLLGVTEIRAVSTQETVTQALGLYDKIGINGGISVTKVDQHSFIPSTFDFGGAQVGSTESDPDVGETTIGSHLVRRSSLQSAGLEERDLSAPGDGLITRDTRTGLDWLDLTETVGVSFEQIKAGAGGWVAAGWRHATEAEMCGLMESFAIVGSPCPLSGLSWAGWEPASRYFPLLGITRIDRGGALVQANGLYEAPLRARFAWVTQVHQNNFGKLIALGGAKVRSIGTSPDVGSPTFGSHLVRAFDLDGDGVHDFDGDAPCATGQASGCQDNCRFEPNLGQTDTDANRRGDACECGNVDKNEKVDIFDALHIAQGTLVPPLVTMIHPRACDADGNGTCDIFDALRVAQATLTPPLAQIVQECEAATLAPAD